MIINRKISKTIHNSIKMIANFNSAKVVELISHPMILSQIFHILDTELVLKSKILHGIKNTLHSGFGQISVPVF